ncbi:Ref family recombination enhancement nuclease [Photobacterium toruni]|uniref:Ref family recombination enhancement nuclease n=1 Tax=Photobacterium toruni TaxID=1935446 RepID=A0ABU6LCE8_9GAMM|nr:Ref family recombination enhancement nuclease [Photobacterium toruni]
MALTLDEKRKRALEKQKAAQKRALEKQRAKQNDPVEIAKKLEKQRATALRNNEKQRAKLSNPEYRNKLIERSKIKQLKAKKSTSTIRQIKPIKNKGLKGRTPTSLERDVMNKIGSLSCICCLKQGRDNPVISLHHLDGRTKENAHCLVLPLCAGHHDTPVSNDVLMQYPDMVPYHAKGSLGGKAAWRKIHGNEYDLLAECYELAGIVAGGIVITSVFPNQKA